MKKQKIELKLNKNFNKKGSELMIKKIAWDAFKKTGDINTFLELKQIEDIEKNINIKKEKDIEKNGKPEDKWNNTF